MSYSVTVLVFNACILYESHILTGSLLLFVCFLSGKVAKEVMEQSAKIKRDPPEIHRSEFWSNISLKWSKNVGLQWFMHLMYYMLCGHMSVLVCVFVQGWHGAK